MSYVPIPFRFSTISGRKERRVTLDEARGHVGNKVVYRAAHVPVDATGEEGVITSVNSSVVFVRYGADAHSKATYPSDISPI